MLNIVLFGPPGAGKGTQSKKLIDKCKLIHLSTGDILRSEIVLKTQLGLEAKKNMDKGRLVPDEVVIGMIRTKLEENRGVAGFIFDGFPRTTEQAIALDELLTNYKTGISAMLALDVDHDELVNRLLQRGKNSGRPDDQNLSIIENRVKVYHKQTRPLIDYYTEQNKFHSIDGMGSIEEIFARLYKKINSFKQRKI